MKKNLSPGADGYYFRVRPSTGGVSSGASERVAPAVLAQGIASVLGGPAATLVRSGGGELVASSLAGKVVAFYCSASWCPPCKQFTPQLAAFYNRARAAGRPFEVVFVSCDRDQTSMDSYLGHMPWPAIPYGSPAREAALATLKVQGIPQLTVFGRDGKVVEQSAVQSVFAPNSLDRWEAGRPAGA
uniref:protein-disulfide reductase n=1 Tax=Hemiselmis andersenii TaxID=464988 RepID=A0A7S1EBY5_HEMAN|mmetsp:Transcript_43855/g.106956  ORF Transcript_43855/g.106956 Transcript_43855/m.106956 type:complete len:186 (+) Transcript_43855:2-559(+)